MQYRLAEINDAAAWLLQACGSRRVVLLHGEMGAGKTTLVKAMTETLEGTSPPSSPSYAIVNEYASPTGAIYHIDLYRLNSLEEAIEAGLEDYLLSGNWCFVEWPELARQLLRQGEFMEFEISILSDGNRKIDLT
ncbi:MAG: tRNA (adenosine(37)-N6)-threonylcarbamoyltransferase complex ATPase subunit type 1 TsaE [Chitinophagales bacterium]